MERGFNETHGRQMELKSIRHIGFGFGVQDEDKGIVKGKGGPEVCDLLFKWPHCGNIGDSKLVFLSFHPLLEAVQSCFGPVLGDGEEGRLFCSQQIGYRRQVVAMT